MKKSDFTILVADDDPDYLFQTVFSLEKAGYKTVAVGSQAEAESVIARFKPSLAIFDLMMESDDSGFILCYKMKRKYPEVPVILATAVAHETGIGITETDRENLFAEFVRIKNEKTRNISGSGLGLSIAKKVIEL